MPPEAAVDFIRDAPVGRLAYPNLPSKRIEALGTAGSGLSLSGSSSHFARWPAGYLCDRSRYRSGASKDYYQYGQRASRDPDPFPMGGPSGHCYSPENNAAGENLFTARIEMLKSTPGWYLPCLSVHLTFGWRQWSKPRSEGPFKMPGLQLPAKGAGKSLCLARIVVFPEISRHLAGIQGIISKIYSGNQP